MQTIFRDITLRFFRSCPVNECIIKRGDEEPRTYKLTESSIARFQRLLRKNKDIKPEIDFMFFTEIAFQFDKEVWES